MTLDSTSSDIRLRNALLYDDAGNFTGGFALSSVLFTSLSCAALVLRD